MKGFGWLNTLYDLSLTGVFTRSGSKSNRIEAVQKTNLYEVLTFLSWQSAKNEYENAVRESMASEAESKQRSKR